MGKGFVHNELAKKNEVHTDHLPRIMEQTLETAAGVGGMLSIENDSNYDRLITRLMLRRVTASGSTLTCDAGVAQTSTTNSDNLLDGVSLNTTGMADSCVDNGTNGRGSAIWARDTFLNISGNTDPSTMAFVGTAYIEYIRLLGPNTRF